MISIDDLDKIITIVEKHNLLHFEYEQENSRVVIETASAVNKTLKKDIHLEADKAINKDMHLEAGWAIAEENEDEKNETKKEYINASLAGTFYLRKNENEEAFVKLGDKVEEGSIVGLIEVMKLFNEIEAEVSGEIADILVKDGDFVEYGQPLFEVKLS